MQTCSKVMSHKFMFFHISEEHKFATIKLGMTQTKVWQRCLTCSLAIKLMRLLFWNFYFFFVSKPLFASHRSVRAPSNVKMKIYYPTSMFNTIKIATTTCFAVESKFIALFQFQDLDIKRLIMFLITVFLKILIKIFFNNLHNKTLRHE
jgi:hypothetical protein